MKILLFLTFLTLTTACAKDPNIYTDKNITCTWDNVAELIICKGDSPK